MTRKMTLKDLRRLIREAAENSELVGSLSDDTDATRLSTDSVDDQIDSMMIDFESYSLKETDPLFESLNSFTMSHILLEQDAEGEDEAEEEDPESPPEDAPAEDVDHTAEMRKIRLLLESLI